MSAVEISVRVMAEEGFPTTTFVNSQINDEAKTFTVTVNVTNNFNYDLTIIR